MVFRIQAIIARTLIAAAVGLLVAGPAGAQNFNKPYPRIGQVTFYEVGAGPEIWKGHDLLIIRFYFPEAARQIKEQNPDVLLMGTLGAMDGKHLGNIPDEWYVKKTDGSKVSVWAGYLLNVTDECPVRDAGYGPQKAFQYVARFVADNIDWRYFDGAFFDSYGTVSWMKDLDYFDFNNDGRADGRDAAIAKYTRGKELLVDEFRRLKPDKLIWAHEAGNDLFLNGNAFEFWTQQTPDARSYNMNKAQRFMVEAVSPRIVYANSNAPGSGNIFRADFASSQIVGAYFGHDEGTNAHRWTYLHDEYEGRLGYPISGAIEIQTNLWVRYFENGVIVANVSGVPTTLTAGQLQGGPYWRFLGNQDPQFNNGQKINSVSLQGYDGLMAFKEPQNLVTPIVIDNIGNNMTTLGQEPVEYLGHWTQSKEGEQTYALAYRWDEFGYYHAFSPPGGGENVAVYRFKVNVPGTYEIYEWHGKLGIDAGVGREASNVPYTVSVENRQITQGRINQKINAGRWNRLATHNFSRGTNVEIRITNSADGYVISDAMRLVYQASDPNADLEAPAPPTGVRAKAQ